MASPFRTFRKNRKAWMVVLTILSMFAFVVLGSSSRMGSALGKRQDPDVFTWDFGTVHKSDIEYHKRLYQALRQFLVSAGSTAGLPQQQLSALDRQLTQFTSEPAIVENMLLEKKAEQMGIVVSDSVVNNFINSVTEDKLKPQDLAEISRQVSQKFDGIGQTQLFDALRTLLAVSHVRSAFSPLLTRNGGMMGAMFRGDTPGDRWDYFCRLNRKVTAEMMPVAVEKFVADIPDPSPEQLKGFYEQYKMNEPNPASPNPGFRQPFKAKFQYIKADYEQLLAAESPKITEQQIKDYYDTHKEEFKKTKLPDLPGATEPDKAGSESSAAPSTGSATSAESKADESKSKAADAKPAESKADAKSGSTKSTDASSKSGSGKTDNSKSGDSKKSDSSKKSDDQKKANSNKQSSAVPPTMLNGKHTVPTSLDGEQVALADTPPSATQPPAAKSAPPSAADSKAIAGKTAEAKSADAKSSAAKSSAEKKPAVTTSPDTKAATTSDRPVEYDPLEKVAATIRNRLAQQKVDEQVDAAFSAIELQLDQYNRSLDTYKAAVSRGNKNAKKPDAPDLTALAKPYGLEAKETELISLRQAYEHTDIGKSRRSLVPGDYSAPAFLQIAYPADPNAESTLPMYQPQRSDDNDNNRYLWWKIADETAHTPTLDEIKPQVIFAWKIIQARKPALAKADEDAAQARKLKQTLKETFGSSTDNKISTVGPFTWLTQPVGQVFGAPPRLTQVSDVEEPGNDFMKSVFALKTGETGVAANEPQTMYYLVQIETEEPSLDTLHEDFMTKMSNEMSKLPYAYIGAEENQNLPPAWLKEVQNEFGYQLAPGETLSDARTSTDLD